jgi:hypothetical protein
MLCPAGGGTCGAQGGRVPTESNRPGSLRARVQLLVSCCQAPKSSQPLELLSLLCQAKQCNQLLNKKCHCILVCAFQQVLQLS